MKKKTITRKKKARSADVKRQNIFEELGFDKSESVELLRKSDLLAHILGIYQDRNYTQAQLAAILDQKQPHISRLLTGKLEDISVDKMISYLETLGAEVEVKITVRRPA